MRIDLHTHSRVSDGTDTPGKLVEKASQAGLDVISLTDHDTFDGIPEAVAAGGRVGVAVLPGIEISCRLEGRDVHLLGYGCDVSHQELGEELGSLRAGRTRRLPEMCARLQGLRIGITVEDVMAQARTTPSIGRPHVTDALVAKGVVKDRQEAFDRYLAEGGPAHVPRHAIELGRGIDLVHEAGGAAVIAHPWGRRSREVLTVAVLEQLTREHGLDGIETGHREHDSTTRRSLDELGARLGLIRTGSSDHHGWKRPDRDLGCFTTAESAYQELLDRIRSRGGTA